MEKTTNRWAVAIAGVIMQLLLGTVYGWSVFKTPLMEAHGWSGIQVGMAFTIAIFCLGTAAALGGKFVDKAGARKVATCAALLFGLGTLLAGYANSISNLWLLWLGYGVIAGIGNGLGYITPIAVLIRWFPDKKGLITGLAVMGFGFGSALIGQIVPLILPAVGLTNTFYVLGIIFLAILGLAAQFLNNPPSGWTLPAAATNAQAKAPVAIKSLGLKDAVGTYQFYLLWLVLFINVTAGIALISNLSPMAQGQLGVTAVAAGTIIFISSLFNGLGRLFWASLSDKIGRKNVFLTILITQVPLFFLLPQVTNLWVFSAMCCYILSCYGGGFATMPSFAVDTFGPKNIGNIYGKILFAWGLAGVVGPMLMEYIKSISNNFSMALIIASALLVLGAVLISFYKKPELAAG
ncbi:oxalate:formate antiporter [Candidatus Saganbacteria bacterium CG08_land_8_20_14_0_20_45_16]|uniref:Oxalate:formate antiporter n=1 Tax=Candidatus Saganbacteria bacterium CG08_land_8_20_14_0_20_45_16 TaxID=2014293 RepID=A0A2H0Y0H9_UNCSA|nr:MAG: oxalate:formate antiporter [Candidatus Saganbacteria bacterium CG08_land_8_20_14_0_20_45_16]